jgi:hypothetical protein
MCEAIILEFLALIIVMVIYALKYLSVLNDYINLKTKPFPTNTEEGDIQTYFSKTANEINFLKGIQWNTIYYNLLLFGGVFAISQIPTFKSNEFHYVFIGCNLLIYFYCSYLFIEIQFKLRDLRVMFIRLGKIFRNYSFYLNNKDYDKLCINDNKFFRDLLIFIPFLLATSASLFFLNYYYINYIFYS